MVVTRRRSASSILPATSRTNSSTGSSRSSKGKGVDKGSPLRESGASSSFVPLDGSSSKLPPVSPHHIEDTTLDDDTPSVSLKNTPTKMPTKAKSKVKSKKSSKPKKHPPNKVISLFDMIARLFLLWLTVYTLSVCPEDTELRSPVCRALAEYRHNILEPYIYPPIRATLNHPVVAPYIRRVQPYYEQAVEASAPFVRRGKREWHNRVIPQLQWLQQRTQPYVLRAQRQFEIAAAPYVQQVSQAALRYRLQAEPYVLGAAVKSHQGWEAVKPYIMPVWLNAKRVPGIVEMYVKDPLRQARRRWVDSHIIKIWDEVIEQGKARTPVVQSTSTGSASITLVDSILVSSVSNTSMRTTPVPPEDASRTAVSTASTSHISEILKATTSALPVLDEPSIVANSISSAVIESLTSTAIQPPMTPITIHGAMNSDSEQVSSAASVPEQTGEPAVSVAPIVFKSQSLTSSSAAEPVSSHPIAFLSPQDDEDIDLEDFLAQLDAEISDPRIEETQPPPPPAEPEKLSQEELSERVRRMEIEDAGKRAEIEAKHTLWEKELERFGEAQSQEVRAILKRLRDAASEEARAPGGTVRAAIEDLSQEAGKLIKSLKVYARKLAAEDKPEKEKLKSWGSVVEKVDKKFSQQVDTAAGVVREWWDGKVEEENREISQISRQVEYVATQAQNDLAFNYTWMASVTWEDWQRYHKLLLTCTSFGELYVGMQNGSVPNAPANPVADVMEAIQEEVDDMILGFDSTLSRVRSAAIDSFSTARGSTIAVSAAAPNTRAGVAEESSTAIATSGSATLPEVSILPIDPSDSQLRGGVPPVILSRGKEEVESAVSKAEEARKKEVHTEL